MAIFGTPKIAISGGRDSGRLIPLGAGRKGGLRVLECRFREIKDMSTETVWQRAISKWPKTLHFLDFQRWGDKIAASRLGQACPGLAWPITAWPGLAQACLSLMALFMAVQKKCHVRFSDSCVEYDHHYETATVCANPSGKALMQLLRGGIIFLGSSMPRRLAGWLGA